MKPLLTIAVCLTMVVVAPAQQRKAAMTSASADAAPLTSVLRGKVLKSWEDFKNRNKDSFSAGLAPGFAQVSDGADGISGKDDELTEMDHFNVAHYELSDFKVRPIGGAAALVTYRAKYDGRYDNSPVNMSAVYGEIWVKSGADWKELWGQETKVK